MPDLFADNFGLLLHGSDDQDPSPPEVTKQLFYDLGCGAPCSMLTLLQVENSKQSLENYLYTLCNLCQRLMLERARLNRPSKFLSYQH